MRCLTLSKRFKWSDPPRKQFQYFFFWTKQKIFLESFKRKLMAFSRYEFGISHPRRVWTDVCVPNGWQSVNGDRYFPSRLVPLVIRLECLWDATHDWMKIEIFSIKMLCYSAINNEIPLIRITMRGNRSNRSIWALNQMRNIQNLSYFIIQRCYTTRHMRWIPCIMTETQHFDYNNII